MDYNATIIDEKEFDNCIITAPDGTIMRNLFQEDIVGIRRRYSDNTYDMIDKKDGSILMQRYDPTAEEWQPRCIHCGKDPYNE